FGIRGAAFAGLSGTAVGFGLSLWQSRSIDMFAISYRNTFKPFLPAAASVLVGLSVLQFTPFPMVAALGISIALYAGLVVGLRITSRAEIMQIVGMVLRITGLKRRAQSSTVDSSKQSPGIGFITSGVMPDDSSVKQNKFSNGSRIASRFRSVNVLG